jgi:putative hydrolase of the HAD superfamily
VPQQNYRSLAAAECRSFHPRLADLQDVSQALHNHRGEFQPPGTGKTIRAILFDFEQTLVDRTSAPDPSRLFHDGAARCYAFLSALEVSLTAFDKFHRQQKRIQRRIGWLRWLRRGEPDMRRLLRRMCRDYGLQRDQASLATLAWHWYEPRTEHLRPADDVIPTLSALADCEIELGLVVNTQWQGAVIDQHLEALGLLEFFPVRAYSTEIGYRKPNPRLFDAALEAMQVKASETMFVGTDPKVDLRAAQRMGMTTVLRRADDVDRAVRSADQVIGRIGELLKLPQLSHVRPRLRPIAVPMPQLIV